MPPVCNCRSPQHPTAQGTPLSSSPQQALHSNTRYLSYSEPLPPEKYHRCPSLHTSDPSADSDTRQTPCTCTSPSSRSHYPPPTCSSASPSDSSRCIHRCSPQAPSPN